ncbi:abl interactor 1-like isoform X1 [Polypterus senegalus]|uniref:abl interactor 1-like isoform X1 n=1 Tax=Polypterus senegalus TaxID=55291 RepID=UPI0019653D92|nr:abl interactor 1-like isoform X1 [Polypterus senegalus]
MKAQNSVEEMHKIFQEAPEARRALLENYSNLHKVAEYCEKNYLQSDDKKAALEETKAFTTQSLASVAYQISTLASKVLTLLDAQAADMRHIESSVNLLSQSVDMYQEKVYRREIGSFTAIKRLPRSQKIIAPTTQEERAKYTRKPIMYSSLDNVGHGVKESGTQLGRTGTMNRKTVNRDPQGTLGRGTRQPEPVQCPMVPSLTKCVSVTSLSDRASSSSFGIAVPPPVIPPTPSMADVASPQTDEVLPPPPPPPVDPASEPISVVPAPPLLTGFSGLDGLSSPDTPDFLPPPPSALSGLIPPPTAPPPPPPLEDELTFARLPLLSSKLSRGQQGPDRPCERRHPARSQLPHPVGQSLSVSSWCTLIIPPHPSYPPPVAPPAPQIPLTRLATWFLEHKSDFTAPPPDELFEFNSTEPPLPPPVDYDTDAPANYLEKVVALYSYTGSREDDLTFQEGDVIYVMKKNPDGWYEGVLNNVTGFFPGNYVQLA